MSITGRDYERIAMCAHPEGTHEHIPLKPGEDPPETCFADCDCEPVMFVRADIHRKAVSSRAVLAELQAIRDLCYRPSGEPKRAMLGVIEYIDGAIDRLCGGR